MRTAPARAAPLEPEPEAPYALCHETLARLQLPDPVRRVAALFDGQRTLEQVHAEAQLPVAKARAVTGKLIRMGVVRPPSGPRSSREPERHFTALEEEFFATPLEPVNEEDLPREHWTERLGRALRRRRD